MPHGRIAAPKSARPSACAPPRPMQEELARGQEPIPARNARAEPWAHTAAGEATVDVDGAGRRGHAGVAA
eukprot:2777438-Alexandrium_andersonii.AAC.1